MVEIEIGVLRGQCLDRRIGDVRLVTEIAAWEDNVMPRGHVSDGCSPLNAPAPKCIAPIQRPPPNQADLKESNPL